MASRPNSSVPQSAGCEKGAELGPEMQRSAHTVTRYSDPVDKLARCAVDAVRRAYKLLQDEHADAKLAQLILDELVPQFAFSGSPKAIKAKIDALCRRGIDEVILATRPKGVRMSYAA
jgi:hypothetical protein